MKFIVLLAFSLLSVHSINILLTTTDNWVSKDTRILYSHLKEQNHNVLLMAPLYNNNENQLELPAFKQSSIKDGGEFGHLLPVHQSYYQKLRKINNKGARNVPLNSEAKFQPAKNTQYGQDPLDKDCWYINSSPLNALHISLNILIPQHYPHFTPDLILVGPNAGFKKEEIIKQMHQSLPSQSIISISNQDEFNVYYQDEKYFNVGWFNSIQLLKHNIFTKNLKFINKKISQLIDKLDLENNNVKLNLKFPSLNHENSHCITSKYSDLTYKQIDAKIKPKRDDFVEYPQFVLLKSGEIVKSTQEQADSEESSKEYASFKFNNDRFKQEVIDLPKRSAKLSKVFSYILSNCNVVLENLEESNRNYEEMLNT